MANLGEGTEMGIAMLVSLLFCIAEKFQNQHSVIIKNCSGKVNGRDCVTHGEDALIEVRSWALRPGGACHSEAGAAHPSPALGTQSRGQEVILVFLLPPRQAWCLWLGEGSLLPLLSARHHLMDPALLQPLALGTVGAA